MGTDTKNTEKDTESWDKIYENESPLLYGYLVKKTDPESASDLLQESFLRLIEMVARGQRIDNYKAYLFQTARNLLASGYRVRPPLDTDLMDHEIQDQNSGTEALFFKKELGAILAQGKHKLNELEKEIFELRWFYGMTQKEIADILSRSERQIRRDLEAIGKKIRMEFEAAGWSIDDIGGTL